MAPLYSIGPDCKSCCALLLLVAVPLACRKPELQPALPLQPAGATTSAVVEQATVPVSFNATAHDIQGTIRAAAAAERKSDPESVDLYAQAALISWAQIARATNAESASQQQAWQQYHDSLQKTLSNAQRHQRLDLEHGMQVRLPGGMSGMISVERFGFAWQRQDFNELRIVHQDRRGELQRYWKQPGLGVPLVVVRRRDKQELFHGKEIPFAATAVLRPTQGGIQNGGTSSPQHVAVLELYDPLRMTQVSAGPRTYDLARDISAPLAVVNTEVNRDNFLNFLRPGREDEGAGLRMIEPYQRGKIPVVFVHGLLSDKFTWVDMVNDLRSVPWINERYQIWAYQYPTGQSFLRSGAEMRAKLREAHALLESRRPDPALSEMVLVGHSMGGLVSKLQVSYSGAEIWTRFANRPFREVQAGPHEIAQLQEMFFFEPLPFVSRVVFVGTPHQGSAWASTLWGRLGADLVKMPSERNSLLKSLMQRNPDVFSEQLRDGIPTSVDLLQPDSPLLEAMYGLPIAPQVRLHTIIGNARTLPDGTPADGVVAVSSSRHPGAVSERLVSANHSGLTDHPDSVTEIIRILGDHLREFDAKHGRW